MGISSETSKLPGFIMPLLFCHIFHLLELPCTIFVKRNYFCRSLMQNTLNAYMEEVEEGLFVSSPAVGSRLERDYPPLLPISTQCILYNRPARVIPCDKDCTLYPSCFTYTFLIIDSFIYFYRIVKEDRATFTAEVQEQAFVVEFSPYGWSKNLMCVGLETKIIIAEITFPVSWIQNIT